MIDWASFYSLSITFFWNLLRALKGFSLNYILSYVHFICHFYFCLFMYLFILRATPTVHESSQARSQIKAAAASLHHSHSHARSLTHWAGPGIEPASSWILVKFSYHWATTGTPYVCLFKSSPLNSQYYYVSVKLVLSFQHLCPYTLIFCYVEHENSWNIFIVIYKHYE